jgi:hypothetical protein
MAVGDDRIVRAVGFLDLVRHQVDRQLGATNVQWVTLLPTGE